MITTGYAYVHAYAVQPHEGLIRRFRRCLTRFVAIASIALALLSVSTPTPATANDRWTNIVAAHLMPDPGPRPAWNASDYDAYRKPGNSTVEGWLHSPNNPNVNCGDGGIELDPTLYPDTPFTRWIIGTWIREIDGNGPNSSLRFPGDSGTKIWIPDFLNPLHAKDPTFALRFAECDRNSTHVTFYDVPPGNYILVAFLQFGHRVGLVDTETGTYGGSYYEARAGMEVWSPSSLIVQAGKNSSFVVDDLAEIARKRP